MINDLLHQSLLLRYMQFVTLMKQTRKQSESTYFLTFSRFSCFLVHHQLNYPKEKPLLKCFSSTTNPFSESHSLIFPKADCMFQMFFMVLHDFPWNKNIKLVHH